MDPLLLGWLIGCILTLIAGIIAARNTWIDFDDPMGLIFGATFWPLTWAIIIFMAMSSGLMWLMHPSVKLYMKKVKEMNKAKELYAKYEADLKELQENCPHTEESDWMNEYWAPGHSSNFRVKTCKECGKIVKREPRVTTHYVVSANNSLSSFNG